MSEVLLADTHDERRRHRRRSVYRTAELVLSGGRDGVGCTILDESEGGLQVEMDHAFDLPQEALIKFSDTASQFVRRCWAKGNRAGFQYIDLVPAKRAWSPGASPPPAQAQVAKANFMAFNDFIHISRALIELSEEPGELLYPAEQIHALLARDQQARQLFAVLGIIEPDRFEEQHIFGPRWMP